MNKKMSLYHECRKIASQAKEWYLVNGLWEKMTNAEARKRAHQVIVKEHGEFRKATVDEEFELEGW